MKSEKRSFFSLYINKSRLTKSVGPLLVAAYMLTLAPAAALAQPGTDRDPVITRSYFDAVVNRAFNQQREQINQLERQLKEIEASLQLVKNQKPPFPDIEGHWARQNITYLYSNGIISGMPDGTFKPNQRVTRAELASLLVRARGLNSENLTVTNNPFKDVPQSHWAHRDILMAREAGIISGYTDGTFRPNNNVTRAEIAAMLTRAFILTEDRSAAHFSDVAPDYWAANHIQALARGGITAGHSDGTFKPNNQATRAEVAAFISRALDPRFR